MTLQEKLDEAHERIRELETALRPVSFAFYQNLNPTVGESVVLEALFHTPAPLSRHTLRLMMNLASNVVHERDDNSVEQTIHRLRKRLAPHEISISRVRGDGFYLDAENKARLSAIRIGENI